MATLATLKTTIANDITRSDLTTEIGDAIDAAIHDVEVQRFWFNETRSLTFSTTAQYSDYTFLTGDPDGALTIPASSDIIDFFTVDWVSSNAGGIWHELRRDDDIANIDILIDQDTADGQPYRWTYYGQKFRFFPIPNDVYSIRIAGHYKVRPFTDDTDTTVWTTEGYELIRSQAAARVLFRPIRKLDLASQFNQVAQGEVDRLCTETRRRKATNQLRAVAF